MFKIKRISFGESSVTSSGNNSINQMIEFAVGEHVKIDSDEEFVANKQRSCGGYSKKLMGQLLGQVVVVKNSKPYCITVEWCGKSYDLHPEVLHSLNEVKPKQDPIFDAVFKNDVELLLQVITDTNIHIENETKQTPLNLACINGNSKEFIEELLECGASVTSKDEFENSAWENCIKYERYDILEIMLKFIKEDPNLRDLMESIKIMRDRKLGLVREDQSEVFDLQHSRLLECTMEPSTISELETIEIPSCRINPFPTTQSLPQENENKSQNYNASDDNSMYNANDQRIICKICCDREIGTSVDCGHTFCRYCVDRLHTCPYCKKDIFNRRPLYLS